MTTLSTELSTAANKHFSLWAEGHDPVVCCQNAEVFPHGSQINCAVYYYQTHNLQLLILLWIIHEVPSCFLLIR